MEGWQHRRGGEAAVPAMTTITIIRGLHVVVAEVRAVAKAEDSMAMKKVIPGQQGKVGEIVIDLISGNFRKKGTLEQVAWCTLAYKSIRISKECYQLREDSPTLLSLRPKDVYFSKINFI